MVTVLPSTCTPMPRTDAVSPCRVIVAAPASSYSLYTAGSSARAGSSAASRVPATRGTSSAIPSSAASTRMNISRIFIVFLIREPLRVICKFAKIFALNIENITIYYFGQRINLILS